MTQKVYGLLVQRLENEDVLVEHLPCEARESSQDAWRRAVHSRLAKVADAVVERPVRTALVLCRPRGAVDYESFGGVIDEHVARARRQPTR